jgi:hypothetical protein
MSKVAISCLLVVLAATAAGCAAKEPLVVRCKAPPHSSDRANGGGPALVGLQYGEQATPIPLDSVQFSNWSTEKAMSIQTLFAGRTEGGTVQLTARFVSCSDSDMPIRVRASFLDANQAPTEPTSAWQVVYLHPRMTAVYTEKSTSRNAANYLLEIMPAG